MYLGVIGFPIKHSVSPPMHMAAMKELGIEGVYLAFEVKPDLLERAVLGAQALGFKGLNVTIPFKEDVLKFAEPKDYAAKIKAANTLDLETLTAYNTDVYGAMKALEGTNPEVALVVGAGGAGKAVALALLEMGATVILTNRTESRGLAAVEMLRKYGNCVFHPFDRLLDLKGKIDLIANATPLGMRGFEAKLPVPAELIDEKVTVFDTVYNPMETPLIRLAKKKGCKVVYGIDMLVFQGAKAFEIWTGKWPPVDVMKDAAIKALGLK